MAVNVLEQYRAKTEDMTPTLVVSTASPFKFCPAVLEALGTKNPVKGLGGIAQLEELTGLQAPAPLLGLAGKPVRFHNVTEKGNMADAVRNFLR